MKEFNVTDIDGLERGFAEQRRRFTPTGMRVAGRAAMIGSGIMTPLLAADMAIAGYEYVQADNAFQRERMDNS